ncbi:MAG: DnaJ domain-containing protein [Alphaproteobacteria bacterium]
MATGHILLAMPAFLFGYYLLGRIQFPWLWTYTSNTRNGRSTIRTPMLELVYERRTGYMDGLVRSGRYGGRRLSELSRVEIGKLLAEAHTRHPATARLLEGYIRHMQSGGATGFHTHDDDDATADEPRNTRSMRSTMTSHEAYDVLGLKPGASRDEIQQAHRNLMKRHHPDHGGSTYLASKINEAKDVLLR